MDKPKKIIKIFFLLPLLIIALPIDGILFAFVNSCSSCHTFGQYLGSEVSLFNAFWLSLVSLFIFLKRKK